MRFILKGIYRNKENIYTYKSERIIAERNGSIVEVMEKSATLKTDILGFDKLYYVFDKDKMIISNRLRDFYDFPIDEYLWPVQCSIGYIPYPFTIFKNVRKALPGIEMRFVYKENSGWSCEYGTTELQEFFNLYGHYDVKEFKSDFVTRIGDIKKTCDRNIIVSFSGGFDSLLLANLFKEHIIGISHYTNEFGEVKKIKAMLGHLLPNAPWYIFDGKSAIDKNGIELYFQSIDEPCFDIAGLAEFLMIKKILLSFPKIDPLYILNGQNADGNFANGRKYFKEYLLGILFLNNRLGLNVNKKISLNSIRGKVIDYCKSTKTRFDDSYISYYNFNEFYKEGIDEVFEIYANSINTDRANFSSFLECILIHSNREYEKFKTIINNFDIYCLLPFCDLHISKIAFSIHSKYKVGYKIGKKILRKSFKAIDNAPYFSESFLPIEVWKSMTQSDAFDNYIKFHADKWLSYRQ